MAWTISKFFSIVIFLAMMLFFFFWIISQVSDLGLFFGFRTSHTVANDIASTMTSVSGISGNVTTKYEIFPGSGSQNNFEYEISINDHLVCVKSYLGDSSKATSDCASHPYDLKESYYCETDDGAITLTIKKSIIENTRESDSFGQISSIDIIGCDMDA